MTLPEATDLLDLWDEEPPAFVSLARIEGMLAAWFGIKRPRSGPLPTMPGLGADGDVHDGLGAAILDFEALKRARDGR